VISHGSRAIVRPDANLEEPRFRGLSGTVLRTVSTGLVWFRLDVMTDGFVSILVHPESLQEITDGTS
jgi:hypothetical protein